MHLRRSRSSLTVVLQHRVAPATPQDVAASAGSTGVLHAQALAIPPALRCLLSASALCCLLSAIGYEGAGGTASAGSRPVKHTAAVMSGDAMPPLPTLTLTHSMSFCLTRSWL